MRFVISTLDAEQNTEVLTKIFSFIEGAAQTKDIQVKDVLQDALSPDCSGTDRENRRRENVHGVEYKEVISSSRSSNLSRS